MASTISDFQNIIKKMHPDVGVATDLTEQTDYNQAKSNPYKRQVTLDNTSKTAKTNYLISFKLDTKTIYQNNDCAWTLSDLRVYDTDETTELNFWVEAPNTPYTTIFVLVPSIASNSTKNIFIYYGNPALKNKANLGATCGSVFTKTSMVAWFKSNEVNRVLNGGMTEGQGVSTWDNKANRVSNLFQKTTGSQPAFYETTQSLNGLPVISTNGNKTLNEDAQIPIKLKNNGFEVSIFSVVYAPTSLQNFRSNVRFQNNGGSDYLVNAYYNTGDSTLKFIISNDGGVSGINTGLIADQWNILGCHWKTNTTNGMQTYRNGSLVAQRNSDNSSLAVSINNVPLRLFSLAGISEFMDGTQADILVFSDFLTTTERNQVTAYLNAKYRVYSTSDMPTITIGSQTASGSTSFSYLSYAPVATFNSNSEAENKFWGIASTTSKATIQNVFNKVLASGSQFESWINSVNDLSGKLTNQNSRKINAGTTITVDEVKIERSESGNNINDIGKFEYSNLIEPNTIYTSTNNDWIEHDFYCEDSSKIDVANSYIRFEPKNLIGKTDLFGDALWNKPNGLTASLVGLEWQITDGNVNFSSLNYIVGVLEVGVQYTLSVELKAGTCNSAVLGVFQNGSPFTISVTQSVSLTAGYQKFALTFTNSQTVVQRFNLNVGTGAGINEGTIFLRNPQLEKSPVATTFQPRSGSGILSYQAALDKNINILESGGICTVKIKKSDFTLAGIGSWSDVSFIMKFGIKTTTGSQNVYYGNFQLKKNFQLDPNFVNSQAIRLRNGVSSDQDVTYFNQVTSEGRITTKLVSSSDITLSAKDYLEAIKLKTFGELDSFPSGFVAFYGDDLSLGFGYKRIYHSYFLKKVLGFIFPKSYLDIDIEFLPDADTTAIFGSLLLTDQYIPNLNYFVILATDKVGDIIDRLLNPTLSYLTYDQVSNKIIARNGYKTWVNVPYYDAFIMDFVDTLPAPISISQTSIYSYKDESVTDDLVFNYINIQLFKDTQENGTIVGFGDGGYELQASGITVLFFEKDKLIPSNICVLPLTNFFVAGYLVAPDPSSVAYNNTGIIINSVGAIGPKVYIEFNNTNASKRYLRAFNLTADYLKFTKNNSFNSVLENVQAGELFDFELKDLTSIAKYGKKKYEIDNLYTFAGIDSLAQLKVPNLYTKLIEKWKEPSDLTGVEIQYAPDIRYGQVVKVRNKEGRVITAHLIKNETYSEGEDYTNTVSAREIK